MLLSLSRAFRISKTLCTAQTVKVRGEGLDFSFPVQTQLSHVVVRVQSELRTLGFSIKFNGKSILSDGSLGRAVTSEPSNELQLTVENIGIDSFMQGNFVGFTKQVDSYATLPPDEQRDTEQKLTAYAKELHFKRSFENLEHLCVLIKNSGIAATDGGNAILNSYAHWLVRSRAEDAQDLLVEAGLCRDSVLQAERTAILADCYSRLKEAEEATEFCQRALSTMPQTPEFNWARGRLMFIEASCMTKEGTPKLGAGISQARYLLERSDKTSVQDFAELCSIEGYNHILNNDLEAAQTALCKSFEAFTSLNERGHASDVAVNYASILISLNMFEKAEQLFKTILSPQDRNYTQHLFNSSVLLVMLERQSEALEQLNILESHLRSKGKLDSELASCLYAKGQCQHSFKQYADSEATFRDAEAIYATLGPEMNELRANNLVNLSMSLAGQDQNSAEAERLLEQAVGLYEACSSVDELYGSACEMLASHRLNRKVIDGVKQLIDVAYAFKSAEPPDSIKWFGLNLVIVDYCLISKDFNVGERSLLAAVKIFSKHSISLDNQIFKTLKNKIQEFYAAKLGKSPTKEANRILKALVKVKGGRLDEDVESAPDGHQVRR